MRRISVVYGLLIGAAGGLLSSISDELSLKIVMTLVGALIGVAFGGAIGRLKIRRNSIPGNVRHQDDFADQLESGYWRHKGSIYPIPGHPDPDGIRHEGDHIS